MLKLMDLLGFGKKITVPIEVPAPLVPIPEQVPEPVPETMPVKHRGRPKGSKNKPRLMPVNGSTKPICKLIDLNDISPDEISRRVRHALILSGQGEKTREFQEQFDNSNLRTMRRSIDPYVMIQKVDRADQMGPCPILGVTFQGRSYNLMCAQPKVTIKENGSGIYELCIQIHDPEIAKQLDSADGVNDILYILRNNAKAYEKDAAASQDDKKPVTKPICALESTVDIFLAVKKVREILCEAGQAKEAWDLAHQLRYVNTIDETFELMGKYVEFQFKD